MSAGEKQILVLVSGLSGGGKTTALHALEDLGYYCVDNLPAALLPEFAHQLRGDPALYTRVSLGIDARAGGPELERIPAWLDELTASGLPNQLLFLTADTKAIIKRFSETRRRHPLTRDQHALPEAIEREKVLLGPLQVRADWVIDTSEINIHQLRRQVWKCIGTEDQSMTVVLESFAFKRGVPQDIDFLFDARHLPNPYWVDELRNLSGLEKPVRDWLEQDETVGMLFDDILGLLTRWLPEIRKSQRSYVTIGIGCTGGRHRSVYLVDRLAANLRQKFSPVVVHHREIEQ
ncbi:MAG TPA: RNase adapter RapZ [Xanthomonadales bacterium]|nr:RNase adapter RapZ [Xanthomonadales bacterium]